MQHCLLMSRGETRARLMQNVLHNGGIPSSLRRSPLELTSDGCGFAVEVSYSSARAAVSMLRCARVAPRKIYCWDGFGYREVSL